MAKAVSFSHLPSTLIQKRSSWRSCTGAAIPRDQRDELQAFVKERTTGLFGESLRFELVAAKRDDSETLRGLGTYGFIRGASGFIVGAIQKQVGNLEDYGYLMEEIVLKATELGLATCWLGGSFQKDNFSARIKALDHEIVPAVVSVGVGADKRNLIDRTIRGVAGSKKRKPGSELFFEGSNLLPLSEQTAGAYANVLEMVRLSPSASNKQPWRLVQDRQDIHFFLKRTPGYHRPNLFSDLQRVDMGIALCHFEWACREAGLPGKWTQMQPEITTPVDWEYSISWHL